MESKRNELISKWQFYLLLEQAPPCSLGHSSRCRRCSSDSSGSSGSSNRGGTINCLLINAYTILSCYRTWKGFDYVYIASYYRRWRGETIRFFFQKMSCRRQRRRFWLRKRWILECRAARQNRRATRHFFFQGALDHRSWFRYGCFKVYPWSSFFIFEANHLTQSSSH
jgi:hypothetical protein